MHAPRRLTPNEQRLERLRSFEDPRRGIRERFLTPTFGGVPTIAVLSMRLGDARPLGWVLCHSYGPEQITLQGLEIPLSRALAAAGFPVLRYHSRGYGDSRLAPDRVTLETHLDDAADAVELLVSSAGVQTVGLVGLSFGGAVAALVADRMAGAATQVSALAAWEPVVRGRQYMQTMLRLGVATELISHGRSGDSPDPSEILRESGVLDVQGFPVRARVFEEVSEIDLKTLRGFRGVSRITQISRSERPRPDLQALVAHLTQVGGRSHLEIVKHPQAHRFGRPRFRGTVTGAKADTQADLATTLVESTVGWWDRELEGAR